MRRALPAWTAAGLVACAASNPGGLSTVPASSTVVPAASTVAAPSAVPAPSSPSPIGRMARIPGATFSMGSEAGEPDEMPVHPTHVAAFEMDLTEVTVHQYAGCVQAGACAAAPGVVRWPGVTAEDQEVSQGMCNENRLDRQDHAANCVDWSEADAYCRWAGKRLPTEEEWEYAACGGDCREAMKGHVGRAVTRHAAFWPFTGRVATTSPGPFGLYDMAGNVWEWTASPYCPYDHPGCADARRVVRGGSWSVVDYLFVRLSDRSPSDPFTQNTTLGFRCAKSSP